MTDPESSDVDSTTTDESAASDTTDQTVDGDVVDAAVGDELSEQVEQGDAVVAGAVASGADPRSLFEARRLTPERAALFQRSGDALAALIEEELGKWLNDVSVRAGAIEETTMSAVVAGDVDVCILEAQEHLSSAVVSTDSELALMLVTLLCGGMSPGESADRPLSRLEVGVLDLLLAPVIDRTTDAFRIGACTIVGHVSDTFQLPDFPEQPAIAIPMQIDQTHLSGRILMAFTVSQLQAFNETVDRRLAGQSNRAAVRNRVIEQSIRPVPVEMVIGFNHMKVPAGDLADLHVGDVLRLRQSITTDLVARVGSERIFSVRAGQRGQQIVAEILTRSTGDDLRQAETRQR